MDHVSASAQKDILVIVFSKTPEKVAHFELVAEGSRVKFIDIHRLAEGYNVAPEDTHDRLLNADQKARAIISLLQKLKDPQSAEHKNLVAQCEALGIVYDENKIFGMIEDSTFTVSPAVWPYLSERLSRLVSDDLLEKYGAKISWVKQAWRFAAINLLKSGSVKIPVAEPGPGAETGIVVSATGGFIRFYNLLRLACADAVKKLGTPINDDIKSQCTVILRPLSAPEQTHEFDAEMAYKLMQPAEGEDFEGNSFITEPYDYVKLPGNDNVPISSDLKGFIRNHGARAEAFGKMNRGFFALLPQSNPAAALQAEMHATARHTAKPLKPKLYKPQIYQHGIADQGQSLREQIYNVINREWLTKDVDAGGIIFDRFDFSNLALRHSAFYDLCCVVVAKQLIARDMFKSLLLWDDGCWKPFAKILSSLANKGMAKDYTPFMQKLFNCDITHVVSSFFDCLRFNPHKYDREQMSESIDDAALKKAHDRQRRNLLKMSLAILKERAAGFHPFHEPKQLTEIRSEGKPPDGTLFAVAHFVSASSENKALIQQCRNLGSHCAKSGVGYVWGGMGTHAGAEAFKAYKKAKGKHAAAYSTPPIAASENEDGCLPANADYREWSRDIYERMAGMIAAADVIVISPGGWGTVQELMALMVLKERAPELFANKKIIVHNPWLYESGAFSGARFWNRVVRTILDVDHRNDDCSSVRDKQILIAHNDHEVNCLIDKEQKDRKRQRRATSQPKNRPNHLAA